MTQPTPPPRCRVLVEGKVCGEIAAHGIHDPAEGHHPFDDLERRVRGERRKLDRRVGSYWSSEMQERKGDNRNWRNQRRKADRRKAGKL